MPSKDKEASERIKHQQEVTESLKRQLGKTPSDISVIQLVDNLMENAYELRASDIHVNPSEKDLRIRFRIDGVLHDNYVFPKELHSEVTTRIKVLAGMRTDEHQAAQDGRFKIVFTHGGKSDKVDVRVSIAPTYYGENCVMRLLTETAEVMTLERLGFSEKNMESINRAIKKPYGLILATGPTGSGKTTTLYAILRKLNTKDVSIITIEDPVEYSLEGVDQIQVNSRTGLTFAEGLRFILRQDPNIIMVGEIRDNETAGIAVNAAMTGHLVLSTLHTNDATTTLPRLIDMGVEPFLISSTVNIAIGQRLVRTLCVDCKVERMLSPAELEALRAVPGVAERIAEKTQFFTGIGCKKCDGSGFHGRIGIHEVLEVTESIRELIMKRVSADEVRKAAVRAGMVTMLEDGLEKALRGVTTVEEVLRVFHE